MEFIIHFVGLIMLIRASDVGGPSGQFMALIPGAAQTMTIPCSNGVPIAVIPHKVYVRVLTDDVVPGSDATWTEKSSCHHPTLKCTLYEIPVASSISVAPGFNIGTTVKTETTFCAMPQLAPSQPVGHKPQVDSGSPGRSLVDVPIAGGSLGDFAMANGNIYTTWHATPSSPVPNATITIRATERASGKERKLELQPATGPALIFIINVPPGYAAGALSAPNPHLDKHFALYNTILTPGTGDCEMPKASCPPTTKPTSTLNLACSNSGCC
jgi:hypothetical protein